MKKLGFMLGYILHPIKGWTLSETSVLMLILPWSKGLDPSSKRLMETYGSLLQNKLERPQVHSISSSFWLLAEESPNLSLAEKKITIARAEQIHKNYFHTKWQLLTNHFDFFLYIYNFLSSSKLFCSHFDIRHVIHQSTAKKMNKLIGPQMHPMAVEN